MAILPGKKAIFYLKHSSIEIYWRGGAKFNKIVFPSLALADQEILDKKLFEKEVVDGLRGIPKQKVVIVLADEILYYSRVPSVEQLNYQEFIDQTPFDPDLVTKKTLRHGEDFYMVAANREYFGMVKFIIERYGFKTAAVIPLVSSFVEMQQVNYGVLKKFAGNRYFIRESNLLIESKNDRLLASKEDARTPIVKESEEDEDEKPVNKKQYILLAFSLLLLGGAVAFGIYQRMAPVDTPDSSTKSANLTITPTITASPAAELESSSESAVLTRQDLKVEILNGTGVAGQAGVVKSKLDELGYLDSITDNATSTPSDNTTVNFSVKVSDGFQAEIITALEELFVNIVPLTLQNTSEYDVSIITGKTL